jgi:MATE family multidrug resistance protein
VRVANELGTGNGKAAKFAVIVSSTTSTAIGVVFMVLILVFGHEFALAFTSSASLMTLFLNWLIFWHLLSSSPVLSGKAVNTFGVQIFLKKALA